MAMGSCTIRECTIIGSHHAKPWGCGISQKNLCYHYSPLSYPLEADSVWISSPGARSAPKKHLELPGREADLQALHKTLKPPFLQKNESV